MPIIWHKSQDMTADIALLSIDTKSVYFVLVGRNSQKYSYNFKHICIRVHLMSIHFSGLTMKNASSVIYPKLISAIRPVPKSEEILVSELTTEIILYDSDESEMKFSGHD